MTTCSPLSDSAALAFLSSTFLQSCSNYPGCCFPVLGLLTLVLVEMPDAFQIRAVFKECTSSRLSQRTVEQNSTASCISAPSKSCLLPGFVWFRVLGTIPMTHLEQAAAATVHCDRIRSALTAKNVGEGMSTIVPCSVRGFCQGRSRSPGVFFSASAVAVMTANLTYFAPNAFS